MSKEENMEDKDYERAAKKHWYNKSIFGLINKATTPSDEYVRQKHKFDRVQA